MNVCNWDHMVQAGGYYNATTLEALKVLNCAFGSGDLKIEP